MSFRRLLLVVFVSLIPLFSFATHIVGGSLTYEHLGGATYRIEFKMYRDCSPSSVFFPSNVRIEVRRPNGSNFSPDKDITIPLTTTSILNPPIDTCAFDPGVCVEEAIYSTVVNNLPPNPGGYHLFYQTCCRNASLVNVNNPLSSGESFYTFIPDNSTYLTNSSPQWKTFTPVFICQGQPLNFDHGATDKDGDSLVYSFYTPFDDNNPTFPGNVATFTPIGYTGAFNGNDPLGGNSLSVNPSTGEITGIPPALGQYVVGVKADEYRNGVLINTIYRDFQFNVLNCPPIPQALIGDVDACSGLAVQFVNNSTPISGNSFYWDFGDLSTTMDNSTQVNPTYTYPSIGTYIVMLIAQYGTPCADTIYDTLVVSGVTADFSMADSTCVFDPVQFTDQSSTTPNANLNSWQWSFGDGNTSALPNPTHTYNTGGLYTVQLIAGSDAGCFDTISKNIFVQSLPIAVARDTFACISSPNTQLNGTIFGANGGFWVGNGTFTPSNTVLNPIYTPTAAELTAGFATIIFSTTGNGYCPAGTDTMTLTFSTGITADAGSDIYVCKDTAAVPLSGIITTANGGQWSSSGTGVFTPNSFDLNALYIPSAADTSNGSVTIILNSVGNGNCVPDADTITIYFSDPPVVTISTNDTACAGTQLIPISAVTTTGAGYWTTLGNGYFTPSDSIPTTNYFADSLDNYNGIVTLVFTSLNNGGCLSYSDTVQLFLIPPPVANFTFVSVCPKTPINFTDSSTSVTPIVNWSWSFGDNNTSNQQNPTHTYDSSGTYNVTLVITSSNGCTDTITKQVLIYELPEANFGVDGVCLGVGSQFLDSSSVQGSTISNWWWDFGDGGLDSTQNPNHTYPASGTYPVQLIVQSAQGCVDTILQNILITKPPTAQYSSSPASVKVNESFSFKDLSFVNIVNWDWDFGDGNGYSTDQNPQYDYQEPGNYTVCLLVTDNRGCKDSVCSEVIVFMPPAVPNAFSPNGDGVNDIFYVLGGPYKELEFNVYNNWGELIFESNDQAKGWDGTKEGIPQPIGVFVYTVKATTMDDKEHSIKGDVTLLR